MIRERIVLVLPELGPVAVRGMSVALQSKNPDLQETLASALGRIEYHHAAARLKELSVREGVLSQVRSVAAAALKTCAGPKALKRSVSDLFFELAQKYYYRAESLVPDPRYETANVWYWREARGLEFTPVPREIFCDLYAMRMARLALKYDRKASRAVSLWLAAGLKNEADLPARATDPTHKSGAPGARYFTLAAGPGFLLEVLARGLRDGDSPVALGAIEALAQTSGADSLVQRLPQGAQPLVRALTFSDRHVRFLAAVSLGDALPQKRFEGSQLVMSVCNEALRQRGKKVALIAMAGAKANEVADAVRAAGYEVVVQDNADKALAAGRATGGIDVVVAGGRPNPVELVGAMRRDPAYLAVPVLVVFQTPELRTLATSDGRVVLIRFDAGASAVREGLARAITLGVGNPLTPEQADQWAIRVSQTIRRLGNAGNKVYDLSRVLGSLTELTQGGKASVRVAAAEALAVIQSRTAQRAISQLACSAGAGEDVRVKAFMALSDSLRRFGNLLGEAEAKAVMAVVSGKGAMKIREPAAQTLGAMNLPSEQITSLMLGAE